MWIAKVALHRPYTFIVLALLTLLLGVFASLRIPIDMFPNINIPVVAAIWSYNGLSPDDMASRIILLTEKNAQMGVSNVEHRAALLSILKTGTSSTLDVINGIKKLPQMRAAKGLHISAISNGT